MVVPAATIPTTEAAARNVVVSAPGKVLLCGGYLILEADQESSRIDGQDEPKKTYHSGVVLAVNRRFYCHGQLRCNVKDADAASAAAEVGGEEGVVICVESPQYEESYGYVWHPSNPRHLAVSPDSPHRNAFVEHTVRICCDNYSSQLRDLLVAKETTVQGHADSPSGANIIRLGIQGDDEFWSHPPPSDHSDEAAQPSTDLLEKASNQSTGGSGSRLQWRRKQFRKAPRGSDGNIMKTGLGSSACLVTSLVAAMDYLLCPIDQDDDDNTAATVSNGAYNEIDQYRGKRLRRIANLAQLCHCVAQGKIGSGFDVSAACWGSHLYRRFDGVAHIASWLGAGATTSNETNDGVALTQSQQPSPVQRAVQDMSWTEHCVVSPIPPTPQSGKGVMEVILADTAGGGSSSPGMSRQVLRHVGSDAWNDLADVNRSILELWTRAASLDLPPSEREFLANRTATEWIELGRAPPSDSKENEVGESVRDSARLLGELSLHFKGWRNAFKVLGVHAGADLEPDAQSLLADSTEQLAGVVTAVVPGAGGHDALACLYVNDEAARSRIVEHWSSRGIDALNVRMVLFGDGVRLEEQDSRPRSAI